MLRLSHLNHRLSRKETLLSLQKKLLGLDRAKVLVTTKIAQSLLPFGGEAPVAVHGEAVAQEASENNYDISSRIYHHYFAFGRLSPLALSSVTN